MPSLQKTPRAAARAAPTVAEAAPPSSPSLLSHSQYARIHTEFPKNTLCRAKPRLQASRLFCIQRTSVSCTQLIGQQVIASVSSLFHPQCASTEPVGVNFQFHKVTSGVSRQFSLSKADFSRLKSTFIFPSRHQPTDDKFFSSKFENKS